MRYLLTLFAISAVLLAGCVEGKSSDVSQQSGDNLSSGAAEKSNNANGSSVDFPAASDFSTKDALAHVKRRHKNYRSQINGFGSFRFEERQPEWSKLNSTEKKLLKKLYWPHDMLHQIPSEHMSDPGENPKTNPLTNSNVPLQDATIVNDWDAPDGVINPSGEPEFGDLTMERITGDDLKAFKKKSPFGHEQTKWAVVVEVHGSEGRLIHRAISSILEEGAGPDVETEVTKGEDGATEVRFN